MMEYAQYQQPPPGQHGHGQGHLPGGYPNSSQHPGSGAPITSPAQQTLHSHVSQASPVLSSQAGQNQGHPINQQMYHQAGYVPQPNMQGYMGAISPAAAAMAATAAASGQNYGGYNMSDPGLPQTSPRVGPGAPVKKERGPRSPQQMNNNQIGHPQIQNNRRMSTTAPSPGMQNAQPLINHRPQPSVPQPHQQSPELVSNTVEESPLYVNAKQFHRILKRRVARQRLEEALRLTSKGRKPYLHESRHNHAMRRPRGPGGRFLTADEVAEIERTKGEGGDEGDKSLETPAKGGPGINNGSGTKRKADTDTQTPSKKVKTNAPPVGGRSSAEDEDEEDDDADDDG